MKEVINPFSFLTEEESAEEIKKIEMEKEEFRKRLNVSRNRGVVVANSEVTPVKKRPPIQNKTNPFINACKKTFEFIKENLNMSVNVGAAPGTSGVIQNPLDKYSFKPKVTTTIQAGPLNIEIDSETILKNRDKGGVITN